MMDNLIYWMIFMMKSKDSIYGAWKHLKDGWNIFIREDFISFFDDT